MSDTGTHTRTPEQQKAIDEFDAAIGPAFVNALNHAARNGTTGKWERFLASIVPDARDELFLLLKQDSELEETLTGMVPTADLLHIATAISAYWRAQTPKVELRRPRELSNEEAQRAEDVAVKIVHDMFKLRGNRQPPTVQEFLDLLQGGAISHTDMLLDRMVSGSIVAKNLAGS
jgi:hypothetical protein